MTTLADRGKSTISMEPLLVGESSRWRATRHDKALELVAASARLDHSLPTGIAGGLARLVRSMNCYYSNLIEGHDTHPVDIVRALHADSSKEPRKRDLQLEARSHIAVQSWIDSGGLKGRAATAAGISEIHGRFCEELPDSLLTVENPDSGTRHRVVPGRWREFDVAVGRHHAVSPRAVAWRHRKRVGNERTNRTPGDIGVDHPGSRGIRFTAGRAASGVPGEIGSPLVARPVSRASVRTRLNAGVLTGGR